MNEPQSTDSQLVQDVLLLSGIFQDTSPGADTRVFDLLHRVVERLRLTDRLVVDLQEAAATLRRYETLHRAKGTEESTAKAEVNAELAARFESTIRAVLQ